MPYIIQQNRDVLDQSINVLIEELENLELVNGQPQTAGNINYIFTRILKQFYGDPAIRTYDRLNTAMGILTCCGHEFERQFIAPYEDVKKDVNGEV